MYHTNTNQNKTRVALASAAQLVGVLSVNQNVTGLIPHQGTFLGCGFGPGQGTSERWSMFLASVFLSFFLHLPPFPTL